MGTIKTNGHFMRVRMAQLELTQRSLAEKTGLALGTIGSVVRGEPVVFETLAKIATALECSPYDLLIVDGFAEPVELG